MSRIAEGLPREVAVPNAAAPSASKTTASAPKRSVEVKPTDVFVAPTAAAALPASPGPNSPQIAKLDAQQLDKAGLSSKSYLTDITQVSSLAPADRVPFLLARGFKAMTLKDGSTDYAYPAKLGIGLYGVGQRFSFRPDGTLLLSVLTKTPQNEQMLRGISVAPNGTITNGADALP